MSTKTVRIADHMQIKSKAVVSGTANSGRLDGQTTQAVSMVGANKVSFTVTVHDDLTGNASLELVVQQSNDNSNWYEKTPRAGSFTSSPPDIEFEGISMAWVRAVFVLDDTGGAPTAKTSVTCDLTTSIA